MSSGFILLGLFTLTCSFFAFARAALVNSHRTRLRQLAEDGVPGASWAERVAEDSVQLLITVQFGQTLSSLLAAAVAAVYLAPPVGQWLSGLGLVVWFANGLALLIVTSLVTILLLFLGEKLPEVIALRNPEGAALSLARVIYLFGVVFAPVVRTIMRLSHMVAGANGNEHSGLTLITEEEIKTMVDAGQEEGVIEEEEKAMIFSIFRFGDTAAREVMVPRIDMIAVDINTPLEQALQVIVQAGHSRIPVYRESIDNIQGILYAKDFLELWLPGETGPAGFDEPQRLLENLMRPAYFVPESKMLDDLLADLQQRKVHIAVVVDEYGGTAGLVTIEDILEEIVGEIQDEYDSEEDVVQIISEHEYVFDARVDLDDVNEMLGADFPTEQGDTLGGFIYSQLGKVPAAGEIIHFDGYAIEVLSVVRRRIKLVRVIRKQLALDNADES